MADFVQSWLTSFSQRVEVVVGGVFVSWGRAGQGLAWLGALQLSQFPMKAGEESLGFTQFF